MPADGLLAGLGRLAALGGAPLWATALCGVVVWALIVEGVALGWLPLADGARRLRARLWLLRVLAVVAPLLGLLGTVSGIIACFAALGAAGGRQLASGISEALVCTAAGLVVAIPAALAHALFARRVATLAAAGARP